MKQRHFAFKANLSASAYNQQETGKVRPSIENAMALCDAHGLTLDWICMGDDRGLSPPLRNAIHALRQMQLEGV
jgi:DNA-binding XRE family transcriptional regulator